MKINVTLLVTALMTLLVGVTLKPYTRRCQAAMVTAAGLAGLWLGMTMIMVLWAVWA